MPSIKGTSSVPDSRARSKALKKTKFSSCFDKPVDLQKVNKPVLTQWIEQKLTSILGFEDEIVSSMAINLFLPAEGEDPPDPKRGQLDLAGFLGEEESAAFSKELWKLMLEAQKNSAGIPKTLMEQKKKELAEKAAAEQQKNPPRPTEHVVQQAERRTQNETEQRPVDAARPLPNNNNQRHLDGRWNDRPPQQPRVPIPDVQGGECPPQLDQFGRAYRRSHNNSVNHESSNPQKISEQGYEGSSNQPYAAAPVSRRVGRDRNQEDDYHYRRYHQHYPYYDNHNSGGERHDYRRRFDDYDDRRRFDDRRRYDDRGPPPGRFDDRRNNNHNHDGYNLDRRYDEDRRTREELEQRLALLKKTQSRKSDISPKVESEIESLENRLYNLERRTLGRTSRGDYGRRDREGERSPPNSRRPKRERDERQRSHSDSSDSDQSSSSIQSGDPSKEESEDEMDDDSRRSRSRSRSYSYSDESRK